MAMVPTEKVIQIRCNSIETYHKWRNIVQLLKQKYPRDIRDYEDALNWMMNKVEKELKEFSFV